MANNNKNNEDKVERRQDKEKKKPNPWSVIVKSDEYRAWKAAVRKKHNYRCAVCGKSKKEHRNIRFDCHHIKPKCKFPNDFLKVENGVYLCQEHHIAAHKKMKEDFPEYDSMPKASASFLWKMVKQLNFKTYNRKRYRRRKTKGTRNAK